MYHSRELRDAAAKTVVHESSRGFRLGKAKGSDRVDPIIALAMAVLMTGRQESLGGDYDVRNFWSGERPERSGGRPGIRVGARGLSKGVGRVSATQERRHHQSDRVDSRGRKR
jgi:hypothetical protein